MQVQVTKDKVTILDKCAIKVHKGEYNVNKITFDLSEEYTDDLIVNAIFSLENGKAYQMSILNNECSIPAEALATSGIVTLGVYAYKISNEELELRYSPYPTYFTVINGSYDPSAGESQEITPSQFEQYMQALQDGIKEIEDIIGNVEDLPSRIIPSGGNNGQVLAKRSDKDYDTEWINISGGASGTTNYKDLTNKPQINGITLDGNLTSKDLKIKQNYTADDIAFFDGETFQEKYDNGELTGPQGEKGEKGDPGIQGDPGPAGADGEDGVGITTITAGTPVINDNKTITPITFNKTDGSTQIVNVEAQNGSGSSQDLSNYVQFDDYASDTKSGVIKIGNGFNIQNGVASADVLLEANYDSANDNTFISKATLENIKDSYISSSRIIGDISSLLDTINGEVI